MKGLALFTNGNTLLIDRGNSMIYSSNQNIIRMMDTNYTQTSGHDSDVLWVEKQQRMQII